jgi:hypothetical protein
MIRIYLLLVALILQACSLGGDLKDHPDLESLPLREATKEEGNRLKLCLRAVHHVMAKQKEAKGAYYERAAALPTKKYCEGIKLRLDTEAEAYEATGSIPEEDYVVRWTVNQDGIMEELSDPDMDDDFEF